MGACINSSNIIKLITNRRYRFEYLSHRHLLNWMSDKRYLKYMYSVRMNESLDIIHPETYNEKLQWLKLYYRLPIMPKLVDKYEVKKYVSKLLGPEFIIPTLGVWDKFDDIDFASLPNQFVLKCTHDSGGIFICKDKSKLDYQKAEQKIEHSLSRNYYYYGREWPYKDLKPRIIAEDYMVDSKKHNSQITSTHINGEIPEVISVCKQRFKDTYIADDFSHNGWEVFIIDIDGRQDSQTISFPETFYELIELSQKLKKYFQISHLTIYTFDRKRCFGTITLQSTSKIEYLTSNLCRKEMNIGEWAAFPSNGGVLFSNRDLHLYVNGFGDVTDAGELKDYKFFCFNGKVKCFKVDYDRFTNHRANYYDTEGNLLPFGEVAYPPDPYKEIILPEEIHKMIEMAEVLAKGMPFVRVDFYNVDHRVYFGEIIFCPASGFGKIEPTEWDKELGK